MEVTNFFNKIKVSLFGGKFTQSQVSGITSILDALKLYGITDKAQMSYCLATAYHETGRTMQPIKEYGGVSYLNKMYDITGSRPGLARANGNVRRGDGIKYCGRGYVQLTWYNNYLRAGNKLGIDLVNNPDLAMNPTYAAQIMCIGMIEGWFTGKKLSNYLGPNMCNWVEARRIINGLDKANTIAGYAKMFHNAL